MTQRKTPQQVIDSIKRNGYGYLLEEKNYNEYRTLLRRWYPYLKESTMLRMARKYRMSKTPIETKISNALPGLETWANKQLITQ